jgi:polar amino acid transport system substrate-binding protein
MSYRSSRALRGRPGLLVGVSLLTVLSVACAPNDESTDSGSNDTASQTSGGETTADACADPQTYKPGVLTLATDDPVFEPWMFDNDPANGKGFESAVAYAVADKMGFTKDDVDWTRIGFNSSYQPGPKKFDFDINQISINPKRAEAVTFSDGYYTVSQAIVVEKDSPYADATSLADFKDATLGAQIGTTSLDAINDAIQPSKQPQVFDDTNIAKNALENGQVDGIVADLPTAFYITAVQIPGSTIAGQFQTTSGEPEEFGLLFEKGNPLVDCANQALGELKSDGTLQQIQDKWLSQSANAPTLD